MTCAASSRSPVKPKSRKRRDAKHEDGARGDIDSSVFVGGGKGEKGWMICLFNLNFLKKEKKKSLFKSVLFLIFFFQIKGRGGEPVLLWGNVRRSSANDSAERLL